MTHPTLSEVLRSSPVTAVQNTQDAEGEWIEVSLTNGWRVLFPCESVIIVQPEVH